MGFLSVFVFLTGASVMGMEMAASRFLAPYFGTSLPVWANLIGLVMLALSAGYYVGGRLADRWPFAGVLYGVVLLAGALAAMIPLLGQWVFAPLAAGIFSTPVSLVLASFVGILAIFFPPVFLLAFVSPFSVRLSARTVEGTGHVAGRLYAFSTAGSILGTFIPAFVTIPFIGTRETILLFSALLILVSAWGLRRWWAFLLLGLPLLVYLSAPALIRPAGGLLYEKDTPYQYVQVLERQGVRYLIINEGGGIQSVYDPKQVLTGWYYDDYLPLPYLRPGHGERNVLIIGSAGGTIIRQLDRAVRPDLPLRITAVEIDPVVAGLGPRYFGLSGHEMQQVIMDGRVFLSRSRERYDLIIVDAYSQELYIPYHLATYQFFEVAREHLRPGGVLAMNVNAVRSTAPLLVSLERTLAAVLPYAYVAPVPNSWNYVLLASAEAVTPADVERAATNPVLAPVARDLSDRLQRLDPASLSSGYLLSDDRSPVELLTDAMVYAALFHHR